MPTSTGISPEVKEAVAQAVDELRQPSTVASRLNAWLDKLAAGEEDLKREDVERRLEKVQAALKVERPS